MAEAVGPEARTRSTCSKAWRSWSSHCAWLAPTRRTHQRERIAAAAGDARVDQGVEHGALGVAQPRHRWDSQDREQPADVAALRAP